MFLGIFSDFESSPCMFLMIAFLIAFPKIKAGLFSLLKTRFSHVLYQSENNGPIMFLISQKFDRGDNSLNWISKRTKGLILNTEIFIEPIHPLVKVNIRS